MTKEVRAAAASALADFEEQLLEHPNIGLTSSATRELKSGAIQKVVRFENGDVKHRAVLVVRYR